MKISVSQLLIYLTITSFFVNVFIHLDRYTTAYDYQAMSRIYSNSQYVKGPAATTSIGDDGLFSVAGYYLLFQGGNPAQIDFENPPLGKYLIGVSIFLFNNERVISIIYAALLLIITYELGMLLFENKNIAALAIFILSIDAVFMAHTIINLLDLPQALWVTCAIYFFIKGLKHIRYWWVSSFFLGLSVSNKFFPGVIFFLGVFGVWSIRESIKKTLQWLPTLILIPFIYFMSYLRFFAYHHSLFDFLRFHKWLLNWRLGNPIVVGNIFYSIFLGKYHDWWQAHTLITYREWTILTPVLFIMGFTSIFFLKKERTRTFYYLYSLCVIFFLYVTFTTTGLVKYLFPIIPLLSIFSAALILTISGGNFVKYRKRKP